MKKLPLKSQAPILALLLLHQSPLSIIGSLNIQLLSLGFIMIWRLEKPVAPFPNAWIGGHEFHLHCCGLTCRKWKHPNLESRLFLQHENTQCHQKQLFIPGEKVQMKLNPYSLSDTISKQA